MLPPCSSRQPQVPVSPGLTDELERLSLEASEIKQGCKRGGGGDARLGAGPRDPSRTAKCVLDGFKQCHLKARYVTEKQIGEGRREKEGGGWGNEEHPLERDQICSKGRGLPA